MKKLWIALLTVTVCLVIWNRVSAKAGEPRVWVDVTNQSPNIFTNADACPEDHPAQIWVLDKEYNSVGHRVRVCGKYNAKGEVIESDAMGRIINP